MDPKYFDRYSLQSLMKLHLKEKRAVDETLEQLEYEEVKGIFRGWKLETLRMQYNAKKRMLEELEKRLLKQCPPLQELY